MGVPVRQLTRECCHTPSATRRSLGLRGRGAAAEGWGPLSPSLGPPPRPHSGAFGTRSFPLRPLRPASSSDIPLPILSHCPIPVAVASAFSRQPLFPLCFQFLLPTPCTLRPPVLRLFLSKFLPPPHFRTFLFSSPSAPQAFSLLHLPPASPPPSPRRRGRAGRGGESGAEGLEPACGVGGVPCLCREERRVLLPVGVFHQRKKLPRVQAGTITGVHAGNTLLRNPWAYQGEG